LANKHSVFVRPNLAKGAVVMKTTQVQLVHYFRWENGVQRLAQASLQNPETVEFADCESGEVRWFPFKPSLAELEFASRLFAAARNHRQPLVSYVPPR
jgi:hypothetical protein